MPDGRETLFLSEMPSFDYSITQKTPHVPKIFVSTRRKSVTFRGNNGVQILRTISILVIGGLLAAICLFSGLSCTRTRQIDRFKLVNRHHVSHTKSDSLSSLSIGNGRFAFTVDITGLQTFPEFHEKGIPLGTMAEWAWHSFPNPERFSLDDVRKQYAIGKDSIPYYFQYPPDPDDRKFRATTWLRENPHRFHLGLLGLDLIKSDSTAITVQDIKKPFQQLNIWTGEITSRFEFEGIPVTIVTVCDQERERISVLAKSALIRTGRLKIKLRFSYPRHEKFNPGYDFTQPGRHTSQIISMQPNCRIIKRHLDETTYHARIDWEGAATLSEPEKQSFVLHPDTTKDNLRLSVLFTETFPKEKPPGFSATRKSSAEHWQNFWQRGGAVDFSECTDPRAFELERRVILSQYLTKIQCTGKYPPQETGLTYPSWHGKFHLEMLWWHGLHYILWGRSDLVEKQLDYYNTIATAAKRTATVQGYRGMRWPKMTDPSGRESPSTIGVFLIWQQPHIIYFADLLYRSGNLDKSVLEKYSTLVFETADFMASYARFDSLRNKYVLGPALIPAQERFPPETTVNPIFELAYWYWGLETAQRWRQQLGLHRDSVWQKVIDNLAPLPVKDSLYLFTESAPDSYYKTDYLTDHPMVLGALGFLPETPLVNRSIMLNTHMAIMKKWNWETCWGWDFPLAAMNATALDIPEKAIDLLLLDTPKNTYLSNGHNYQNSSLSLYLPGNGGLLTSVAMLCGYHGKNGKNGFPDNGRWKVRHENVQSPY